MILKATLVWVQNFFRLGTVAVGFVFIANLCQANSYYVDYGSGTDTNGGASTATAWQHCPGDSSAAGNAASATLRAGDTVYFKGGVSYILTAPFVSTAGRAGIALNWAGTTGNPITYDGNSAGSWGTGRATITDHHSTNYLAAFQNAVSMSNLVFKSFVFTAIGGSNAFPAGDFSATDGFPKKPGYGISAPYASGIYIDNCYFGQLGYYRGDVTNVGNSSLQGSGVSIGACDGVTITNCEFTQVRNPVQFGTGNTWNLTVANCNFHDQMEWGITVLSVNSYRSNIFIHDCAWTNTDQYYVQSNPNIGVVGLWTGYGGGGPHCNGIMMFNEELNNGNTAKDRPVGDRNVFIYNNKFTTTMGYTGGTTTIWVQDSTSADIYNNVFYLTAANNAVVVGEPATNTVFHVGIYNNTFYCGCPAIAISGAKVDVNDQNQYWPPVANSRLVEIKNNVFSTLNGGNNNAYDYNINFYTNLSATQPTNNILFDYNGYFCDQAYKGATVFGFWSPYQNGFDPNGNGYITTNTSPILGWDRHSVTFAAPPFLSPIKIAPFNADLHLPTNSAAIGAGINLTSLGLPGLNTDRDGNARPATGNWTIGAYQGASTAPLVSLVASKNIIDKGQSVTLTWTSLNATSLTLSGVGILAPSGTMQMSPAQTTNYVMTAAGANGTSSANTKVVVRPSAPTLIPP